MLPCVIDDSIDKRDFFPCESAKTSEQDYEDELGKFQKDKSNCIDSRKSYSIQAIKNRDRTLGLPLYMAIATVHPVLVVHLAYAMEIHWRSVITDLSIDDQNDKVNFFSVGNVVMILLFLLMSTLITSPIRRLTHNTTKYISLVTMVYFGCIMIFGQKNWSLASISGIITTTTVMSGFNFGTVYALINTSGNAGLILTKLVTSFGPVIISKKELNMVSPVFKVCFFSIAYYMAWPLITNWFIE